MKKIKLKVTDKTIGPVKKRISFNIGGWKIFFLVLGIFVVLSSLYFYSEIRHLIKEPSLTINQPPTDITTAKDIVKVSGETDPGSFVLVNGNRIGITSDGSFSAQVQLSAGVNMIEIEAVNRFDKGRKMIRKIIYMTK
ncbi:MAG: hypothetical protein GF387_02095 [Candidatus Portnoybacteria bacterium]|nr:hypothetical protein [Candidatus Portnoybacteria bacterium]